MVQSEHRLEEEEGKVAGANKIILQIFFFTCFTVGVAMHRL